MAKQDKPEIIQDEGGLFNDLGLRIKLIIRLLLDRRVNFFLKLLPIFSFIYLIIPGPIPPDIIPTPIDDALLLWLATYLFVELCPDDIVLEHMHQLNMEIPGKWRDISEGDQDGDSEIIDAEWEEASSND